jgi:glyoxylase-like metal-dependent hydrolase (beta-lactamase superfamily II)
MALAVFNMAGGVWAASGQAREQPVVNSVDKIEVHLVQNGVYLLVGAGANVVAQVGVQGVLLVDSGAPGIADEILTALGSLTEAPIRYVINTSGNVNHTGGNEPLSLAGANEAVNVPGNFRPVPENAPIIAREEVYLRMAAPTGQQSARPFGAWPTSTFFSLKKTMYFNGEGIEILHQPAARTDGNLIVFFRRADVIAAGDVFVTDGYPVIELSRGGSIQGLIDSANRIIDIAIPRFNQQGGTLVVPGHGRISNEADVVEYRDMLTIIRDRIQRLIDQGMTIDQVKAEGLTLDYDGVYGATEGSWTTAMFIEAIYRSLQ